MEGIREQNRSKTYIPSRLIAFIKGFINPYKGLQTSWYIFPFPFKELESLKSELEESIDTTTAAQEMKQKRESELVALKRSVEEETVAHEAAMAQLRQKHTQLVEELNVQLETAKKVWINCVEPAQGKPGTSVI